jgi:predicted RND superfamily exporter protein
MLLLSLILFFIIFYLFNINTNIENIENQKLKEDQDIKKYKHLIFGL